MPQVDYLESWTVMSAMATVTSRIRIGSLVICNSFRNPYSLLSVPLSAAL